MKSGTAKRFAMVLAAAGAACCAAGADAPEVTSVVMSQDSASRLVTIEYELANSPAIVTVDIETNATVGGETVWESIGGENIQGLTGDVNCKIATSGTKRIFWRPDLSWNGRKVAVGGARAVVTAWSLDNPPDYMVADLSVASPQRLKFYPGAEFLPGGITSNDLYCTSSMVFRKIKARGIPWQMGVGTESRTVTLDADYYIGVFEVTQGQLAMVGGPVYSYKNTLEGTRRPVESQSFREVRDSASNSSDASLYPSAPAEGSLIGKLKARVENLCDFDLPSEAQWEYAARAGHGEGYWNDGSRVLSSGSDANLMILARYAWNCKNPGSTVTDALPADNNTDIVGRYMPNSWGLYDMHGNVNELCLDWWTENADARDAVCVGGIYTGAVNADGANYADGVTPRPNAWRVTRGGAYNSGASACLAWARNKDAISNHAAAIGFRLVCPVTVK